ncbi:MAG TPA: peptidoglycan editing factor PgeF [Burkholderiales bacterium]|nr:peptidoglycan editing factor PgeF [Burkholderiales bacterium]
MIRPDWRAPARVQAFATTRAFGDLKRAEVRAALKVPREPAWLKQVHGKEVARLPVVPPVEADAAVARSPGEVCVVQMADCMPVLFADEDGTTVAAAHAGWRGLSGGVLEETLAAMGVPRHKVLAWLGPAIGPQAYEVGEDVRAAFAGHEYAFTPNRPGHWLLDLYAVARRKLEGLKEVSGGGFCTFSEADRFFSYRRDRTNARMGAFIWLA